MQEPVQQPATTTTAPCATTDTAAPATPTVESMLNEVKREGIALGAQHLANLIAKHVPVGDARVVALNTLQFIFDIVARALI